MKEKSFDDLMRTTVLGVFIFLSVFTIFYFIKLLIFAYGDNEYVDFVNYYMGAKVIKLGLGTSLYNIQFQINRLSEILGATPNEQILLFRAIPAAALLFIPSTFFPVWVAYRIYLVLNLVTFIFIGKYFNKVLNDKYLGYLLLFSFLPIVRVFASNQLVIFFLVLYLAIYLALKRGNTFLVGLITGLFTLKLNIFIVVATFLLFFVKDKLKYVLGLSLSFGALLLVCLAISGVGFPLIYLKFVMETESATYGSLLGSYFSLQPFFVSVLGWAADSAVAVVANYAIFFISLLVVKHFAWKKAAAANAATETGETPVTTETPERTISLMILFSMLFGYHVFFYESVILIIPLVFLAKKLNTKGFKTGEKNEGINYLVLLLLSLGTLTAGFFEGLPNITKPLFLLMWLIFLLSGYNLDLFRNFFCNKNKNAKRKV